MKAAVLTVSDGVAEGTREDTSGDLLAGLLASEGYEVERRIVPDDRDAIAEAIAELAEESALVLTTGGTGLAARDVTPEATAEVLERRSARDRGGDPGRLARQDPACAALPRGRGRSGRDPGGQPARLTWRLSRRLRGAPAGAWPTLSRCSQASRPHTNRHDRRPIRVYPRRFYSLVKFEHTVFALPFAYVGAFLAVDGVPSAHDLLWITVAMVGARSLAMGLNRLIDAGLDARNPRTAGESCRRGCSRRPR